MTGASDYATPPMMAQPTHTHQSVTPEFGIAARQLAHWLKGRLVCESIGGACQASHTACQYLIFEIN